MGMYFLSDTSKGTSGVPTPKSQLSDSPSMFKPPAITKKYLALDPKYAAM